MTKDEIIEQYNNPQKINGEWEFDLFKKEDIHKAMDEYAKQEAIEFHVFVTRQNLKRNNLARTWKEKDTGAELTDEAVWEIYLQYKEYLNSKDSAF